MNQLYHLHMYYTILQVTANTSEEELITAAVVIYTNRIVYMGVLENDQLTYCKTSLGKLHENCIITKINTNSVTLNKKTFKNLAKRRNNFLFRPSCVQ